PLCPIFEPSPGVVAGGLPAAPSPRLEKGMAMPGRTRLLVRAAAVSALFLSLASLSAGPAESATGDTGPVANGALPGPFPLFPATNWWNLDVTGAPLDPGSAAFISF